MRNGYRAQIPVVVFNRRTYRTLERHRLQLYRIITNANGQLSIVVFAWWNVTHSEIMCFTAAPQA
ncbi:hypothetical protein A3N95_04635 [Mycobacteroides abscessus]|nr:hypothetical protein A3N95_04635 [Mycobacteroides abscessus]